MKIKISWGLQVLAAAIMLQTLYFKFTAAPESVALFTKLGMEPWGRLGTGMAELIASILILIPRSAWLGAFLGLGLMAGAIFSHITVLGLAAPKPNGSNDGGLLFSLAIITFLTCLLVLWIRKKEILNLIQK